VTYEKALGALAGSRDDVVVLTAENRAPIRNLPTVLGERFVDVGICEQTLVGAAAGLALRGRTPVVHALAAFLTMRAFEFVRTDVGLGRLPVKLVGYVPGFLSEGNGPTHQALEDVALMRGIPGMQVFCPADEAELVQALPVLLDDRSPCYIRYNAGPPPAPHTRPFAIGQAEVLREGNVVTILTYGLLVREALKAQERLREQGVPTRVVNLRMLKPIDERVLLESAHDSQMVVTLEDHFLVGGLRSIVAEIFVRQGLVRPLLSIALEERWFRPALLDDVLEHEGFEGGMIAERVLSALESPQKRGEREWPTE
jgi:transketolase